MKYFLILSLFLPLIIVAQLKNFCSVVCAKTGCIGDTPNDCNSTCQTNWIVNGSTCIPNSAKNYYYQQTTPDLNGTLSIYPAATDVCGPYTIYGWSMSGSTNRIVVTYSGVTVPFYSMTWYFGSLSPDGGNMACTTPPCWWNSNTSIYQDLIIRGSTVLSLSQRIANKVTNQFYCLRGNSQFWNRHTGTYAYNITQDPLQWDIYNDQINTTAVWGIKQFILLVKRCNINCTGCFGLLTTQCYSCIPSLWLSKNTCSTNCLANYGKNSSSNVCIFCDPKCTNCQELPTNCSACTKYGTNAAFLDLTTNTCINQCLTKFFGNITTRTCDPCPIGCLTCTSATRCTSCDSGYGWMGFVCYNPCPAKSFLSNGTNCSLCNVFCTKCEVVYNNCTSCVTNGTYASYLYNISNAWGQCVNICPNKYYKDSTSSRCLNCYVGCALCTNNPSPCSSCAAAYYLWNQQCLIVCPSGLMQLNLTTGGVCFDCIKNCVDLVIKMYFPDIFNSKIYVDFYFSLPLNFITFDMYSFQTFKIESSNFKYTNNMFNFTYLVLGTGFYRIIMQPKSYIFLYNATITVTTMAKPSNIHTSLTGVPFKQINYQRNASLNWFLIKGAPFTTFQQNLMKSFSTLSTKTNNLLTHPYIQQIKKSGIFNLLFSGAQITSCTMLSNQIQSQNLYEGVRFWAVFVFFDAPQYQQISNKTKYIFLENKTVENAIRYTRQVHDQRRLFSTDVMYWRFQRTGYTSFFLYDCYIQIVLLVICWILLFIVGRINDKKRGCLYKHISKVYTFCHKVHEFSMMYIVMTSVVQFIYFQPTTKQRYISIGLGVIFNIYFIAYELYIYKQLMKFPMAILGSRLYDQLVLKYGCLLKNIRYEQYPVQKQWKISHLFRPYNYHVLSYYKKFLMMITLPLFYNFFYYQMTILTIIQILEIIRICYVKPFAYPFRNNIRISFDCSLLGFFIINLLQIYLTTKFMQTSGQQMKLYIQIFHSFGWVGFGLCFYFNMGHLVLGVYDFCIGMSNQNRYMIGQNRKKYYYNKIQETVDNYIKKQQAEQWFNKGNLKNLQYGQLQDINIRIEQIKLKKQRNSFHFQIKKINSLKMKTIKRLRTPNNTTIGQKIQKHGILREQFQNKRLFKIFQNLYYQFEHPHVQTIIIKTFLQVQQKQYEEGDHIVFDRSRMFQKVQLISYDNDIQHKDLNIMLQYLPLDPLIFQENIFI